MGQGLAELKTVLLGRKTYDIFAGYWPKHGEEPGAAPLSNATNHVASRTRKKLEWENARPLEGDVKAAVKKPKAQPGGPIQIMGSANFLQSLLKNDLVDELHLWIFPVVIGSGKRLFGEGAIPSAWKPKESTVSTTGVVIQRYERAGDIKYGAPPGT